MKTRIYFLDNLRSFLILLVVLLHAGLVYESILERIWIVSDPIKNNSIGLIRMYLDLFVMFSIFFISGYFIPFSLKEKSTYDFLKSKFKRIMLPWVVAVFTLIPAYKFIFLYSRGLAQQEWYSYFHFFERTGSDLGFYANNPNQNWLWFLPVLFMFQLIYLVLKKSNLLLFKISIKSAVALTIGLGLVSSMLISHFNLTGWYDSPILHFQRERILIYFMAFLLGSLSNKLKVFESGQKNKKHYVYANIVLSVSISIFTVVALNLFFNLIDPNRNFYLVSPFIDGAAYYTSVLLCMLSFLYVLIHVFRFNFNNAGIISKELNKNAYQVYIIHMIVLGVVAYLMLKLEVPAFVKFIMLTAITWVLSNTLVFVYRIIFKDKNRLKISALVASILIISTVAYVSSNPRGTSTQENVKVQSNEMTLPSMGLHEAIIRFNDEVIQQHINARSDLNVKEATVGSSPLITAATFGNYEAAKMLIAAGADVNFKNNDGATPLHSAAFFCREEIVELLLMHRADKNITNHSGATPLAVVTIPYDQVKGMYEYFGKTLAPLGLQLDHERIVKTRPVIAQLLR